MIFYPARGGKPVLMIKVLFGGNVSAVLSKASHSMNYALDPRSCFASELDCCLIASANEEIQYIYTAKNIQFTVQSL